MFSYGFQPWAALTGHQILEAIDEPNFQVRFLKKKQQKTSNLKEKKLYNVFSFCSDWNIQSVALKNTTT